MPFARVRDIDVYYEIHGEPASSPTGRVLSISGTGGDLRHNPLRGKGPLEQRFEVLMYDQRGLGQTSKPDVPYTMADYADDAAALLDAVGWDRCHVVGMSFGGMVAQNLVVRHPDRVLRLVLACTSPGGAGGSSVDLRTLEGLPPDERQRRSMELLDGRVDLSTDPPTLPEGFGELMQMISGAYASTPADDESAMGARRQLDARAGHDVWDALASVQSPTLVIGGRDDLLAPAANHERMAERIPGARLELCEGGHLFMLQDPTAWPTIVEFLEAD
jgi:3-oxoadipate enol-lactonase